MAITNPQSRTSIDAICANIYRINTPVGKFHGGFSFNQYLLVDEQPLLFHTGPKKMLPLVCEAIATIIPVESLSYIGFSHYENDECGSINDFLRLAPEALPLCGAVNARINADCFDRSPKALADGESLSLGKHRVRWIDAPHLPHGWECGYLFEETTATLFCGDLFSQGGSNHPALTTEDILGPSEKLRSKLDYYSHTKNVRQIMARLAATQPKILACMHGSAWQGDGASLLTALGEALDS